VNAGIESEGGPSKNAIMQSAYVVRELVSVASGEKELRTHYEYGTFPTYQQANECAIETKNPSCFPQREDVYPSRWAGKLEARG
jgi:hypothetical protein